MEKPYVKMNFFAVFKAEILKSLKAEKLKGLLLHDSIKGAKIKFFMIARMKSSRFKVWACRIVYALLLWTIAMQFKGFGELKIPKLFHTHSAFSLPPKRIYENNGYLMVSSNGGLNQMRAGICDMVAIARYLNVTLVVPELDNTSFWNDHSQFKDIFDVDYFIESLRDEVQILKELPPKQKKKVELESLYSMPPISWSNMTYYNNVVRLIHFKSK
ncbi:hypothetical protein Lal_00030673 [Lupinus albus]|nr:hypothetical protein Lal_00030673 [Lupinus albus]